MTEESLIENRSAQKKTRRRHALEWLGTMIVGAAILYFYAPPSWWQFGVARVENRPRNIVFSLKRLDGDQWDFAEMRGRVVVVNYWATWCGPCRFETPGLVNVANEYKPRGVEVIGVTVDDDLAEVPPFVEKYKIPYAIVLPGNDPNLDAQRMVLPTTFLYDKKGLLAKKYTGIVLESTLRSDIEELLAEP